MTKEEIAAEALARATQGNSLANYPAIFAGFAAKGIAAHEIEPRVNVLTFHAWKARGRVVRKGEKGVKVVTFIDCNKKTDPDDPEAGSARVRKPKTTTVFHISQTDPIS